MCTQHRRRWSVGTLVVGTVVASGLFWAASQVQGQVHQVANSPVVVEQTGYYRVYEGSTYHWTPAYGWHRHDYYRDVPYRTPVRYYYATPPRITIKPVELWYAVW